MIDHDQMQLALRTRLASFQAATTGSASLGASGTTFTRTVGSFLADGFAAGMEVAGTGFSQAANNAAAAVAAVAAQAMTVDRALTTEAIGAGKVLAAGLPARRAWENIELEPRLGYPYVEEEFLPGPSPLRTLQALNGTVETIPMYRVLVHVPENVGVEAMNRYADQVATLFYHGYAMTLTNGDTLRVRADTGPYRGQVLRRKPGWATVPVTIPLRLYTLNNP